MCTKYYYIILNHDENISEININNSKIEACHCHFRVNLKNFKFGVMISTYYFPYGIELKNAVPF